jgi:peptidylprolyl isomerase
MRSSVRRATTVLLVPLLAVGLLSGCGSSSKKASSLPKVAGSYGSKPTFTFPGSTPSKTLQSKVLREGTGPVVAKGDLLVADYLGQIWQGAVFDNSYDRMVPAGFPIGAGQVIPAWDEVLVGAKAGSRVLMSIPPDKGYGTGGNPQAGIKGTDTLVFVVDIVASYNKSRAGDPSAVAQKSTRPGITVTGALGAVPTVKVKKGTKVPKKPVLTVLAKGSGAAVKGGLVVVQYALVGYDGTNANSTWKSGSPAGVTVSPSGLNATFDVIRGLPLGSRVLLEIPGTTGANARPAVVAVVDLVAQPTTAAAAG